MKDTISKCTMIILLFGLLYLFIQIKRQERIILMYNSLLDRVYNDNPGYVLDVLIESDEYSELYNLTNN